MKILSRKVIASVLVFLTATVFVWYAKIDGIEWVKLAIVTVMAYIAGEGLSHVAKYVSKKSALGSGTLTVQLGNAPSELVQRIKSFLDAPFVAAIAVYVVATFLMWNGKISPTEWNYVAMGTIVGYDILNPIGKLKA